MNNEEEIPQDILDAAEQRFPDPHGHSSSIPKQRYIYALGMMAERNNNRTPFFKETLMEALAQDSWDKNVHGSLLSDPIAKKLYITAFKNGTYRTMQLWHLSPHEVKQDYIWQLLPYAKAALQELTIEK